MEANVIKCPNCGANATNHTNCEYCGSLLVRFVEKGIEISDTSYIDDSLVFPGLFEELEKNLRLQEKGFKDEVYTVVEWLDKEDDVDWLWISSFNVDAEDKDNVIDNKIPQSPQLVIQVDFEYWNGDAEFEFNHNKKQDEQFMKFTQLKSFPLFTYRKTERDIDDNINSRQFDINFGQDAKSASRLISEILIKVKGLTPSDSYGIYTGVDDEAGSDAYKVWRIKHGFESEVANIEETNTEKYENYYDNNKESLSIWDRIVSIFK